MNFTEHLQRYKSVYYLCLICVIVLILSVKGITDEATVSLNGDMPKYLMNGVFFHDLINDLPVSDLKTYTYRYFAQYPALSLGHHPLLLGIAEVPFFYLFGISVYSARLTIIFFTLIGVISWYLLVRSIYGDDIALLSSLLFITSPLIVNLSWEVMSEMPTLSLVIASTYLFYNFCRHEKSRYAYAFSVVFVLSVYAKHTAILMVPVYLSYFLLTKGIKRCLSKDVLLSVLVMTILIAPLIPLTLKFSHYNVALVTDSAEYITESAGNMLSTVKYAFMNMWKAYSSFVTWILAIISACFYAYRRDKKASLFIIWVIGLFLLYVIIDIPTPRHTIYYIPPLCLLAALSFNLFSRNIIRLSLLILLTVTIGHQVVSAYQREPEYVKGYEQAAQYILKNDHGSSVLYSGVYDTGYFIFFMRKHDPQRHLVILRANKILATSNMSSIVEDRIKSPEEIYKILGDYGVRYVVIEDVHQKSPALEWLRQEAKSDRFNLIKEIILISRYPRVNSIPLSIYEYKGYSPPREGQILHLNIPLMDGVIEIPLADLLHHQ
jgi:hypothetical protein